MKQDIHPKWYKQAKVICACGHIHTVGSTEKEIRVEICSNCHPFYTGAEKLIDTEGRVEKFEKKERQAAERKQEVKKKEKKSKEKSKTQVRPKTLKEMMNLAKP